MAGPLLDQSTEQFYKSYERSLKVYALALGMIFAMLTTSFFIERRMIKSQKKFANIINVSGKQRVLTQRISTLGIQLQLVNTSEELLSTQAAIKDTLTELRTLYLQLTVEGNTGLNTEATRLMVAHYKNLIGEFFNSADLLTTQAALNDRLRLDVIQRVRSLSNGPILELFDRLTAAREQQANHILAEYMQIKYFLYLCAVVLLLAEALLMFYPLARKNLFNSIEILNLHENESKLKKFSEIGEAFSGIIHEINNPLSVAMVQIRQIKNNLGLEPPPYSELEQIEKNLDRITHIIKSSKAIYRSGENDPIVPVMLARVIDEAVESSVLLKGAKDINFIVNKEHELVVTAREHQVLQVCMNLIINAIDAVNSNDLPEGANPRHKEIIIDLLQDDHFNIIRITDSGPGVPEESEEKIFQSLYTTKLWGTGMGLTCSQQIMQSYNGAIRLNRKVGNSCFEVLFPRA